MNGAYQRQQLPVILAAAQAAEDEDKGVQDIARGLLGQGFYSNIIGDDASAYPSQAEKTLSRGYVACQPADDDVSLATMHWCMRGDGFDFMTKTSSAVLHPVTFGCRRTRGNETKLHSHLGEGFATCALVSDSLGLQTVMRSSSSSRTTGETPPFSACRCGLCAGIWTLSIETTLFWVMLTIGHASVQTFVSILCLRPTSSR
jgi:hypothetical protein